MSWIRLLQKDAVGRCERDDVRTDDCPISSFSTVEAVDGLLSQRSRDTAVNSLVLVSFVVQEIF